MLKSQNSNKSEKPLHNLPTQKAIDNLWAIASNAKIPEVVSVPIQFKPCSLFYKDEPQSIDSRPWHCKDTQGYDQKPYD